MSFSTKKLTYSLSFLLFIIFNIHCISNRSENEIIEPPTKAKSFPELSERNRLLGALSPGRTCYDVLHYMINVDIDIDKKTKKITIYPVSPVPSSKDVYAVVFKIINPQKSGLYQFHSFGKSSGVIPVSSYLGSWTLRVDQQ